MTQCVLNYRVNKNQLLGKGGFGNVYLAINEQQQECACKIISLQSTQNHFRKLKLLIDRELSVMSTLDDPTIVKMIQQYYDGKYIYIFMEYCNGGTLKQKVRDLKVLNTDFVNQQNNEKQALEVFWSLLDSLSYLYQKNIIHRDIKLENVLIHNGRYKLSDFGLSKFLSDIDEEPMNSILGTPCYQSPQILRHQTYSPKTDIWSFGVLLFELIKGELPFKGYNTQDLLRDIEVKLKTNQLFQQLQTVQNKLLTYLLKNMLVIDEDKRISLKDLIEKAHHYRIQNAVKQEKENPNTPMTECRFKPYKPGKNLEQMPIAKRSIPIRFQKIEQQKHQKSLISRTLEDKFKTNLFIIFASISFIFTLSLIK